jgi:hypothetical protein
LLNRRGPEGPAGYEDGKKLSVEPAFAHPWNVDVPFRIAFAKIKCAAEQTLRSVGMRIEDDRGEMKLVRALGEVIRRSAASEEKPGT